MLSNCKTRYTTTDYCSLVDNGIKMGSLQKKHPVLDHHVGMPILYLTLFSPKTLFPKTKGEQRQNIFGIRVSNLQRVYCWA